MKNSWQEVKLGQVLGKSGYIRGPFGSALRRNELQSSGIPVYEQQHAIYDDRTFRYFIDDKKHKELSRFTVKPNDLIISCSGTLGRISIIQENDPIGIISQALLLLRPDTRLILPKFLYYFFRSPKGFQSIVSVSSGSVQVNIAKRSDVENVTIDLPPLPEQRAIAGVLGALDDKIELNRRMNRTLESLARAVFRQWFVESEEVQGWASGFLCDIANVIKGVSYRSVDLVDSSNTALVTLKSMERGGGYREDGLKPYAGEYKAEQKLSPGEVVVAHTDLTQAADVIGKAARIEPSERHPNLVASLDLAIVRPKKNPYTNEYLYGLLSQSEFSDHAFGYTNGTTVLHLSSKALPEYQFKIPPKNKVEEYSELVKPIYRLIDNNKGQSRTLASLRDALLPKLMRGEVRVKA